MLAAITAVLLIGGRSSAAPAQSNDVAVLDRFVRDAMPRLGIPGMAFAAVTADSVVFARGWGVRDVEHGGAVDAQTGFYIASSTKSFVGLLSVLLDRRGWIDLDAPLTACLPGLDLNGAVDPDSQTLRDMLRHTRGWDADPTITRTAYTDFLPPTELRALLAALTTAEGGGAFDYGNDGYVIADLCFREHLGIDWKELLETQVLVPGGMMHTTPFISKAATTGNFALPHLWDGRRHHRIPHKTDDIMHAAGGLVTNAEDAGRWIRLHLGRGMLDGIRVFPADAVDEAISRQTDADASFWIFDRPGYGLGWYDGRYRGERLVHHFGGYTGAQAHISFMPERDVGVAAFVNGGGGNGYLLPHLTATLWYDLAAGRPDAEARARAILDSAVAEAGPRLARIDSLWDAVERLGARSAPIEHADRYTGVYRALGPGTIIVTERSDGGLWIDWGAREGPLLRDGEPGQFLADWEPGTRPDPIAFESAANGPATAFVWRGVRVPRITLGRASHPTSRSDSGLAASVRTWLDRIEAFGFSGVALVARGDSVIHASAHGFADREANRPFTTGTVFGLGSVTKVYTAAAILRLVDRGALALSDTLGAFVPDMPADRAGITLEQLLTHSSGLGEIQHPDEDAVSRRQLLDEMRELPLLDAPGASVSYSNLGFSLLGVVLEEATGLSYEDALRREVLEPAGARETGYTVAWGHGRLAAGYRGGKRWGTIIEKFPDPSGPSWTLVANGALHSTLRDAFRFVRAFVDGEIVSPGLAAAAMQPRERFRARGLGWQIYTAPDGSRAVGHDGSNNFLTASVRYLPEHDITVILAANQTGFTAIDAMPALLRLVNGMDTPLPPAITAEPLSDAVRSALAGTWEVGGGRLEVLDAGDHLQIQVEGQALLDRILDVAPAVAAHLTEDTERADRMIANALSGDFAGTPVLQRVWNGIEARFGAVERVEVLGSAPVWYASARATWVRFRFAGSDRTHVRRLHWSEAGQFYGVGGSVYPAPLALRCVGTAVGECQAMHLHLAIQPVRLTLRGGDVVLRVGGIVLHQP